MTAVIDIPPHTPDYSYRTPPGRVRSLECARNRHFCDERGCGCNCHLNCGCCQESGYVPSWEDDRHAPCYTCEHSPRSHGLPGYGNGPA